MKKRLLLTALLLASLTGMVRGQDYDFAQKIGGNMLYFYILSERDKTLEVTYPGPSEDDPYKGKSRPSGKLSIPQEVIYDSVQYTVTAIRYGAFKGCKRITMVVLPGTLREIGEEAFAGCTGIESMVCMPQQPPKLNEDCFVDVDIKIPVIVPTGTQETYRQAFGWRIFENIKSY